MVKILLVAVVAAVGYGGWWLVRRVRDLEQRLHELRQLQRELERRLDETGRGLQVTRAHVSELAAGDLPDRADIMSGKAWRDVQPAPALVMWQQQSDLVVLDVRTQAEWANGHIPRARLVPLDELEDRLKELPDKDAPVLVHCAAGGRSLQACRILADHGWTRLFNLAGGMHAWPGPREKSDAQSDPLPANLVDGTKITHRGGTISEGQVVDAIRQCFDPEIPLNIYDLGLIYDVDIAPEQIAVRMTLTSESCPSARTIPQDVKEKIGALGHENVTVDVVFDPPWHPSRISDEGKQKLGLG